MLTPNTKKNNSTAKTTPARGGQPPCQETFMMREYMPTELIDLSANFQQKAKEIIPMWLEQLQDT